MDPVGCGQDGDGEQIPGDPVKADPGWQDGREKGGKGDKKGSGRPFAEGTLSLLQNVVFVLVSGQGQGAQT